MAGPQCMSGDGNAAVFVGTMLETGDSVELCDVCLVAWAAALLQAMTGVDPEPFLRAISDDESIPYEVTDVEPSGDDPNPPAEGDSKAISQGEPAVRPNPRGRGGKAGRRRENEPGPMSDGLADPGTDAGPGGNGGTAINSSPSPTE